MFTKKTFFYILSLYVRARLHNLKKLPSPKTAEFLADFTTAGKTENINNKKIMEFCVLWNFPLKFGSAFTISQNQLTLLHTAEVQYILIIPSNQDLIYDELHYSWHLFNVR